MRALAVNAGSTSVKVSTLLDGADDPDAADTPGDLDAALAGSPPDVVLHRVVHGGERSAPALLDDTVVIELRSLTSLAPLHQPPALDAIDRCRAAWPQVRQIACFDTSFHRSMPAAARTYALPERLRDDVHAYGFHGLSYAWSSARLADVAPDARRVLIAHLGGGQSLCAVRDGRSIDTTMGFTPLDGLVMATRSGALDPGALLFLQRNGHEAAELDTLLEQHSGLLALAGSGDMKTVLARAGDGDAACALALDVWTHRFLREAGGCIAVLGGLDALVFTGGIGENAAEIRRRVADGLDWLGVALDELDGTPDAGAAREISGVDAAVRAFVVHAREDRQMWRDARSLLAR